MQESIKIPTDRIAVLVGTKGSTKRMIEKKSECKLTVDSKEGDVLIEGDSLAVFTTKHVIKAIARGFNPDIALKLLKETYVLEILNIRDYAGNSKNKEERLRSRVIGTEGKAKQTIEYKTNSYISVYGKTVAIIADSEHIVIARFAVNKLLQGAQHGHTYRWIEDQLEKLKSEHHDI